MGWQPKAAPMGITPPPRWTPPITPTPEPTLTPTEWPPLDFWNYPDYYGDHRDNLRTKGSEPFWMRDAKKPGKYENVDNFGGDYMLPENQARPPRVATRMTQDEIFFYNCPTCHGLGLPIEHHEGPNKSAYRCRVGHSWDSITGRVYDKTLTRWSKGTWRERIEAHEYDG